MRVTFLNTFDGRGGAARAAYRLFQGVSGLDTIDVRMIVQEKVGNDSGVSTPLLHLPPDWTSRIDSGLLKKTHPNRERVPFSVNRLGGCPVSALTRGKPDLVHLHWPHAGFIRLESLARLNRPIVWTIHDMWAFTGVCHYSGGCEAYLDGCGCCPLLRSGKVDDVSARNHRRKALVYPKLDLTVVSPSNWLARLASSSPLLKDVPVKVIPNGISTDDFRPRVGKDVRRRLSLPMDKTLLAFGADFALTDRRKGALLLLDVLAAGPLEGCELLVFGSDRPDNPPNLPMKVHWMGPVNDDALLADIYSAADVFIAPSLQENLSNTVMESLSCGTPVIAFDIGGMGDLITDHHTGMLVPMDDGGTGLRAALGVAAGDVEKLRKMGLAARESVLARFRLADVAKRYARLYADCLERGATTNGRAPGLGTSRP